MKKAVIFDLDGTLYFGGNLVDGALETITALTDQDYRVFFLTNNSGKTRQEIVDKLKGFGFQAERRNTYCCSYAIAAYLTENKIMSVYVVGAEGLKRDLESYNIRVKDSSDALAVVVGLDLNLSYNKITIALDAISNGAKLIVANIDLSYPIGNNRRLPGCGAIVGAIVGATGHDPDFQVGKPNIYMLELICKEHSLSSAEICMVGDEPESDIKMAVNFQCQGVLFDPKDAFPEFPDSKIKNLREIILLIKKGG